MTACALAHPHFGPCEPKDVELVVGYLPVTEQALLDAEAARAPIEHYRRLLTSRPVVVAGAGDAPHPSEALEGTSAPRRHDRGTRDAVTGPGQGTRPVPSSPPAGRPPHAIGGEA